MKYIIFVTDIDGLVINIPVTFSKIIIHKTFAEHMKYYFLREHGFTAKVKSAGFINSDGTCHGESESLGVSSDPEDTDLIRLNDYIQ